MLLSVSSNMTTPLLQRFQPVERDKLGDSATRKLPCTWSRRKSLAFLFQKFYKANISFTSIQIPECHGTSEMSESRKMQAEGLDKATVIYIGKDCQEDGKSLSCIHCVWESCSCEVSINSHFFKSTCNLLCWSSLSCDAN